MIWKGRDICKIWFIKSSESKYNLLYRVSKQTFSVEYYQDLRKVLHYCRYQMAVFMIIVLLVIHRWLLSWGQNLKNMISMHIVPLIINCINVWTHHRGLNLILETRVYWFVFEFNDFWFSRSGSPSLWAWSAWPQPLLWPLPRGIRSSTRRAPSKVRESIKETLIVFRVKLSHSGTLLKLNALQIMHY